MIIKIIKYFFYVSLIIIGLLIGLFFLIKSETYIEFLLDKHKNELRYNDYKSNGYTDHVYYSFFYVNKEDFFYKRYNFYIEENGDHFFYVLNFNDPIKKILLFLNLSDRKIKYIPSTSIKREEMDILNFLIVKYDLFF